MADSNGSRGRGPQGPRGGGDRSGGSGQGSGGRRSGPRPDGGRGGKPDARGGKPDARGGKPDARGGKPDARGGKPDGRSGKPSDRRGGSDDRRGGAEQGNRPGSSSRGRPAYRGRPEPEERTADQKIYDGPPIPDDISAKDLDKFARQQLQSLPEKLADKVARHLVMAGLLMHEDPEQAYLHALAARGRATRSALVREACGETAYAAGKWAEALSEFRASRRMSGNQMYAPMMADCERALRRPDKAIAYDTPEVRAKLDDAGGVELSIVVAGARRDQGQAEAAVRLLETEPLHTKGRGPWVARLRYAYADALLDVGRTEEAIEWFHRTVAVDGDHLTDAVDRIKALEG